MTNITPPGRCAVAPASSVMPRRGPAPRPGPPWHPPVSFHPATVPWAACRSRPGACRMDRAGLARPGAALPLGLAARPGVPPASQGSHHILRPCDPSPRPWGLGRPHPLGRWGPGQTPLLGRRPAPGRSHGPDPAPWIQPDPQDPPARLREPVPPAPRPAPRSRRPGPASAPAPGPQAPSGLRGLRPGAPGRTRPDGYASGRTTPRIFIEPAPATVTVRPGLGECTIRPSPM